MAIGMALSTAEIPTGTRSVPRINKQYRLIHRRDDGTAQYRSVNDTEGSEMLWVYPDGSTFRHIIVGACNPCEMAEMYADGRPGCGLGTSVPMRSRRFTTPNWVRTAADVRDAWSGLWRGWAGRVPLRTVLSRMGMALVLYRVPLLLVPHLTSLSRLERMKT
jgi:hypothetical protein